MKRLEIRLVLPVVAPLLRRLQPVVADLRDRVANPVNRAPVEGDLGDMLQEDLVAGQGTDLDAFVALFGEQFFETGLLSLAADRAEPVLRATAALRLRLRERELERVPDAALEAGDLPLARMDEDERTAYRCYLLLATLQELVLQVLDPRAEPEDALGGVGDDLVDDGDDVRDDGGDADEGGGDDGGERDRGGRGGAG